MTVCVPCYKHLRNTLAVPAPRMPEHFDDLWRKCNKQGYLRVRRVRFISFEVCLRELQCNFDLTLIFKY